jgi:hypothetical protein
MWVVVPAIAPGLSSLRAGPDAVEVCGNGVQKASWYVVCQSRFLAAAMAAGSDSSRVRTGVVCGMPRVSVGRLVFSEGWQ